MELQYQITKEQLIVPMPKEVDHHIAKTISREIDFLIDCTGSHDYASAG